MSVSDLISAYIHNQYPKLGVNKSRQIVRLVYEIAKRENQDFHKILPLGQDQNRSFTEIKNSLIERRYPHLTAHEKRHQLILSKLDIDPKLQAEINSTYTYRPEHLYIETAVARSYLARRIKAKFPRAKQHTITSIKEVAGPKKYTFSDYNSRSQNLFIIQERFNFFTPCPCSTGSARCGYQILNLGLGCAYECAYCHLQAYMNAPGIVFPANIEDFFARFKNPHQPVRLGTGEFTDSLLFDDITGFSHPIIEFFRQQPNVVFEFKTKSVNIAQLKKIPSAPNIVIAWSLNPPDVIREYEFYAPSLDARLKAAQECVRAGYRVAFHFDPIIITDRWQHAYQDVITRLYATVRPENVAWISLGALRLTPRMKRIIENRFPTIHLLDGEFIRGFDGKLRYPPRIRLEIFTKMISWIRIHDPRIALYLCMEDPHLVRACRLPPLKYANAATI